MNKQVFFFFGFVSAIVLSPRDAAATPKAQAGKPGSVARMPHAGEPMILATYAGDPANMKVCQDLGFTIFQTDSDHLSTNQTGPGAWDWTTYDKELDKVHKAGAKWMFFPHFAYPPPWYRKSVPFTRVRCLEHDKAVEAFSPWDPRAAKFLDEGYRAMAAHYGSSAAASAFPAPRGAIFALYLGVHGDYGECMFPAACRMSTPDQRADWQQRFGDLHNHYGYWCGDELARADFRRAMLAKYGGLQELNRAWGTAFADAGSVGYPLTAEKRRWRLDFVRWYLDGMGGYARNVAKAANRHFPDTIKMFPLGGGDEDPRPGQDNTALVKMAAEEKVQVRSTHGGFRPFAGNASSQLARIATACKFYGVPFWSEPPAGITPEGEVGRIFESICSGASGFWDWHANPVQPEAQAVFRRYRRLMIVDPPVVEVAVLYPQTYHYLHPEHGFPPLLLELGQELRDLVHFDILDENLIADGALARYRYLIHLEGDVFERSTLERIGEWVRGGGVFCGLLPHDIETVEGDRMAFAQLPNEVGTALDSPAPRGPAAHIHPVGAGAVCLLKGGRQDKQEYVRMLRDVLYLHPPGKDRRPVPSIDTDMDGIYGVVLRSGRSLLYNPSGPSKSKIVHGVRYDLPPASIVEVK